MHTLTFSKYYSQKKILKYPLIFLFNRKGYFDLKFMRGALISGLGSHTLLKTRTITSKSSEAF